MKNRINRNNTTAVLMVSFGTSYRESCDLAAGATEEAVRKAFPDYEVRRAFTSQRIIHMLKERDGVATDDAGEALERALRDGITDLVLQPVFLVYGCEYARLEAVFKYYKDRFRCAVMGKPLLAEQEDMDAVIKAVTGRLACYDDGETAVCLMGHGTEGGGNDIYARLQNRMQEAGYQNYYIGTMRSEPGLEDVLAALRKRGFYRKAVLYPFMLTAGAHARNEMAGSYAGTWKTVMESEGYEVACLLEGLGQIPAVQDIYVKHVREALLYTAGLLNNEL